MVSMPTEFLKRLTTGPWPTALLSALLLLSLYLMSGATDDSATFNQQYDILLISNIIGLTLLVAMIAANGYRLYIRYKRSAPGSRLTTRLLTLFIIIAVAGHQGCVTRQIQTTTRTVAGRTYCLKCR